MDTYEELETNFVDDAFLGDDEWKHLQMDDLQTTYMDLNLPTPDDKMSQVIYDCMWNGGHSKNLCATIKTEEAPGDGRPTPAGQVAPQQSLLKPYFKLTVDPNTVLPMTPYLSLQTPPISDDEDTKPTHILQSLQSALSENELDDGELSDYFKGDVKDWTVFDEDFDDEEEEEQKYETQIKFEVEEDEEDDEQNYATPLKFEINEDVEDVENEEQKYAEQRRHQKHKDEMLAFYAATDHSYHKGPNAAMHAASLGIDTPSDSEEEIDVVSLGDKFTITSKSMAGALPTNPSNKDRRQLQMTMQSRFPRQVKTIMPMQRSILGQKKGPESRGRPRQYKKMKQNPKQYKKRCAYGPSSDSEPEPMEKRHLHNNMERQRRIDLRNLFNDLKKLVPDVNKKQRAAKVLILRGAAQYCQDLTKTHEVYTMRVENLRQQQARLRAQLSKLRRDCAAKR